MNKKYYKYLNTLFVVVPMTMIMAVIGVSRTHEFCSEWFMKFIKAWSPMLSAAYIAAFINHTQYLYKHKRSLTGYETSQGCCKLMFENKKSSRIYSILIDIKNT